MFVGLMSSETSLCLIDENGDLPGHIGMRNHRLWKYHIMFQLNPITIVKGKFIITIVGLNFLKYLKLGTHSEGEVSCMHIHMLLSARNLRIMDLIF